MFYNIDVAHNWAPEIFFCVVSKTDILNGEISAVLSERTKSFNELVRSKNIIGIEKEKP